MILQQLTLRNFGLFRDRQVFDLAPVVRAGKNRPIVLFGGINGGGKTTLFDAIQLALYGPRARCAKRASLAYTDFLVQSIHHGVSPADGAGVALAFRSASDGQEHDYEVRRSWQLQDGKLRESLLVYQDGLPNHSLAAGWPQLVEELIPLEISQLFFFDGEKIRTLAEDASSSEALGAAIKALLGLDLVERLITDATVLQSRLAKKEGTPEHRAEVGALELQTRELQAQLARLKEEKASLENDLQRANYDAQEAEEAFRLVGGKHWNARQDREKRQSEVDAALRELEAQLVALSAGELPLALVPELLARVEEQAARERQAAEAAITQRLLAERDARLLEALRTARMPARVCQLVYDHLEADRQARQTAGSVERRLALSDSAHALLQHLRGSRLNELHGEAAELLQRLASLQREREDLDRARVATPDQADIESVAERLKVATAERTRLQEQADRLKTAEASKKAELKECQARLRRLWQGELAKEFESENLARMVVLAGRTRDTMQEFLRRATERKIDRLSVLITESFRFLLRKQTLVERVWIEPATFAVTLYDAAGQALSRQRLSEGEKQIFAVALLWGLARASARPLPAGIDTPMARLDATHRRHLVERYFPQASHQVVILSTDTEVDGQYYGLLQPFLARAYHLDYDEESRATVGREGYFWMQ
jgi:DNA sulfur modification protein DndD